LLVNRECRDSQPHVSWCSGTAVPCERSFVTVVHFICCLTWHATGFGQSRTVHPWRAKCGSRFESADFMIRPNATEVTLIIGSKSCRFSTKAPRGQPRVMTVFRGAPGRGLELRQQILPQS
jgi:hypothetical protein